VRMDTHIQQEIRAFIKTSPAKSVIVSEGNMGCIHEEGDDFPEGGDCPFCPFWKGQQGSAAPAKTLSGKVWDIQQFLQHA